MNQVNSSDMVNLQLSMIAMLSLISSVSATRTGSFYDRFCIRNFACANDFEGFALGVSRFLARASLRASGFYFFFVVIVILNFFSSFHNAIKR